MTIFANLIALWSNGNWLSWRVARANWQELVLLVPSTSWAFNVRTQCDGRPQSDVEAAREAYDAFLSHYPYCYGYWRKYADYEKRKGSKKKCLEVSTEQSMQWYVFKSHGESNEDINLMSCDEIQYQCAKNTWILNCFGPNRYFAIVFFPNSASRPVVSVRQSRRYAPESIKRRVAISLDVVVHYCVWCIPLLSSAYMLIMICTRMIYIVTLWILTWLLKCVHCECWNYLREYCKGIHVSHGGCGGALQWASDGAADSLTGVHRQLLYGAVLPAALPRV